MSSKRDKEKPSKISIAKREARNDVKSLTKEMNDLEVKDGDTTSDLLGGDTVQNKELSEGCMRLNMVKQIQDISKVICLYLLPQKINFALFSDIHACI